MALSARPLLASALLALLLAAASAADSKSLWFEVPRWATNDFLTTIKNNARETIGYLQIKVNPDGQLPSTYQPRLCSDNPADELVTLINANRTASKASSLADNQGLGCIALQYIKAYKGECNQVGANKKPIDSSFTDTFAPNCGVQATTLAKITGRLLACQPAYPPPAQAFDILITDARSLEVLHSKNHTEVGAAVTGTSGVGPYFWCVLFSSGKPNSSFTVEGGVPKEAHPGCFSGNNDECSGAISTGVSTWRLVSAILFALFGAFTL